MADVAVVIGHHPEAKGSVLRCGERTIQEYDFWAGVGQVLADVLAYSAEVVHRPNPEPDDELAERINATDAKCAVELHFNSYKDPEVSGTEMLHYPDSEGGKMLAHLLHESTVDALGTRRRGVKPKRGYPFLSGTEMPAVICEPGFGSNEADAWALLTRQSALLLAYKHAIERWLSNEYEEAIT